MITLYIPLFSFAWITPPPPPLLTILFFTTDDINLSSWQILFSHETIGDNMINRTYPGRNRVTDIILFSSLNHKTTHFLRLLSTSHEKFSFQVLSQPAKSEPQSDAADGNSCIENWYDQSETQDPLFSNIYRCYILSRGDVLELWLAKTSSGGCHSGSLNTRTRKV